MTQLLIAFLLLQGTSIGNSQNVSITVGIFASSATNPNVDSPVSTAVYTSPICGASFVEETTPIANPREAYWEWPAEGSGVECRVSIFNQIQALAVGTYKAAYKVGSGQYTSLSTTFTRS